MFIIGIVKQPLSVHGWHPNIQNFPIQGSFQNENIKFHFNGKLPTFE